MTRDSEASFHASDYAHLDSVVVVDHEQDTDDAESDLTPVPERSSLSQGASDGAGYYEGVVQADSLAMQGIPVVYSDSDDSTDVATLRRSLSRSSSAFGTLPPGHTPR